MIGLGLSLVLARMSSGGAAPPSTADAKLVWDVPAKSGFVYFIRMF